MGVDKVYEPQVVEENPFPQEGVSDQTSTQSASQSTGGQVFRPETTVEQTFPSKRVAVELLSVALNTKSKKVLQTFTLTESGGFQIGKYENGVSGDIRITPNGITARNAAGNDTFSLDGTTGDAVFSGEVRSGSTVSGNMVVTEGGSIQVQGADGMTVIDSFGLVSQSNFSTSGSSNGSLNQTFTTNGTTDVTGSSITFTLPRSALVLFLISTSGRVSNSAGNYIDFQVSFYLDGASKEAIDYQSIPNGDNSILQGAVHYLQLVTAGTHTIKLVGSRTNATGSPSALLYRFRLSYLVLGT